jgi:hypothetical protein
MQTATYCLPVHWASALINGDETGDSDEDSACIAAWLEAHPELGACLDVSDEGEDFRTYHDARCVGVLACDCAQFTFPLHTA